MSEKLCLWIPTEASRALYEQLTQCYGATHPSIEFEIEDIPLETYWTTLRTALNNQTGPDLFFMHNEHAQDLINDGVVAPYAFTPLQKEMLNKVYPPESDQHYYYDFAYLTSLLYTKKDFDGNGMNSWEDCTMALQKDTTTPYAFGCSVNLDATAAYMIMMSLQHKEDLTKDHPKTTKQITNLFQQLSCYDPKQDCKEAFVKGEIQMVYSWGWFAGYLNDAKMEYKVYPLCHEPNAPYYDRRNTKSSLGINANSKHIASAKEFVYTFLSDAMMQKKFCMTRKVVPLHHIAQQDEDIQNDRVIMAQTVTMPRTYFPPHPMQESQSASLMKEVYSLYETK